MKIAVTMGDPAGIGAEVILKALAVPEVAKLAEWVLVGDRSVLEATAESCGLPRSVLSAEIIDLAHFPQGKSVPPGQLKAECGAAAVDYVRVATEMCLRENVGGMVTAPLNKEAVTLSGMKFSGHTEYIAELCGTEESRMLLAGPRLSVVHVSTHIALRQACEIKQDRIVETVRLGRLAMNLLGHKAPRIVVCGLNPHAGEHGLFGREDAEIIVPAVEAAQAMGIPCVGPAAPDTVFMQAARGRYDLVVAMYHDQGHIPMKLLDFDDTVNISLGLPIVRTSVDHGTAFDIAGKNMAGSKNMESAMRLAVTMASRRADMHARGERF
jgi:4-phospho-D-threonate 3-dehydrogenase / 4-phospho-D-erythronate 3-dehydrogenase